MKTRQTLQCLLLPGAVLAAGCVTHHQACPPSGEDRTVLAIAALYEDTRVLTTTNGRQRYVLVPEPEVLQSAETMLLRYSRSEKPIVRGAAACRLAHFGTTAALRRALELAHAEASPETRAGIWSAIAKLVQSPQAWPITQSQPTAGPCTLGGDSHLVQALFLPDLRVVLSCSPNPADFILPPDTPVQAIESEIIEQYAVDGGSWPVAVVDRIPFVPFSARRRILMLTVRQSIADALQESVADNERLLAAFREFSRDENEAINRPARQVVETGSRRGGPKTGKSSEARTSP